MSGATIHTLEGFPSVSFPTIFVDGISNSSISHQMVKYYFHRFEPSFQGGSQFQVQPVAQIVTSVDSFAYAALFLNQQMELLIERGFLTREKVDEMRRRLASGT